MRQGSLAYREWYARENELRQNLATLTGTEAAGDIALMKNTTEGICAVAFGLDWRASDNIVLPQRRVSLEPSALAGAGCQGR